MMLGPVMTLVNGPTIADAIADPQNEISKLVATETDDSRVVNELFLRILSRPATKDEIATGIAALHASAGDLISLKTDLIEYEAKLDDKQREWEAKQAAPVWTTVDPAELHSSMNATFTKNADHSVSVTGANGKGSYTVALDVPARPVTAIRLELLADPSLPAGGPGRAANGNLVLAELKATVAPQADPSQAAPVEFARSTADFGQSGYAVAGAIDGNPQSGWAISPQFGKDHWAVFEFKEPIVVDGGARLSLVLDHQFDDMHTVGKFRVAVTSSAEPTRALSLPGEIAEILAIQPLDRSDEQKTQLADYYHALDPQWVRLHDAARAAAEQQQNVRLTGAQDLAWALINSPAFLFNR